jgi:hypothetical protein
VLCCVIRKKILEQIIKRTLQKIKKTKIKKKKTLFLKLIRMFARTNRLRITMKDFVAILSLAMSLQLCWCDSNTTIAPPTTTISELSAIKNEVSDYADEPPTNSSSVRKQKPLFTTGNELWDSLIRECLRKPSFSCIQKNVYTYLDSTLALNDVNVTNKVQLTRNQLQYEIPKTPNDEENEIYFEGRGEFLLTRRKFSRLPRVELAH